MANPARSHDAWGAGRLGTQCQSVGASIGSWDSSRVLWVTKDVSITLDSDPYCSESLLGDRPGIAKSARLEHTKAPLKPSASGIWVTLAE